MVSFHITKKQSKILSGIAILLMLYHHMYCDPKRLECRYYSLLDVIFVEGTELKLGWFCKLCVAFYSFITGYGICCSLKRIWSEVGIKGFLVKSYLYIFNHLLKVMKKYWLVFAIFIPLGYMLGVNQGKNIAYLITDFLGITHEFNSEWWYLLEYMVMLFLAPVISLIVECGGYKRKEIFTIIGILTLALLYCRVSNILILNCLASQIMKSRMLIYFCVFLIGYICARWELFNILNSSRFLYQWRIPIAIVLLSLCSVIRIIVVKSEIDSFIDIYIIAPIVWSLCRILEQLEKTKKVFEHLGRYSTYIWITHTFFCYYYFQDFITISKISTLMYLQLMFVSYVTARMLDLII